MAIIILLVFSLLVWLVLILPRQRELKRHRALMDQVAVGEEVMMTSGIYGVIAEIEGDYVQLEIADGLTIKIAKRSIAARVHEPAEPAEPADEPAEPAEPVDEPADRVDDVVDDVANELDDNATGNEA